MNTPTTGISWRGVRPAGRSALLLLLTLLALLIDVAPAAAETPAAPDDMVQLLPQPTIALKPSCNPDGFHFAIVYPNAPRGAIFVAQWREAPNGPVNTLGMNVKSGFVNSGQGDFQVRAIITLQGQPVHKFDWTNVTVFCPGMKTPEPVGPVVTIDVEPRCEPDPGIAYAITVESPPPGPLAYKAQWREENGPVQSVAGQNGVIATGEGDFEIRGVLYDQGPGFYATEFVDVTVDCADDPGDGGDDPGDDLPPSDPPRPGRPTFTG